MFYALRPPEQRMWFLEKLEPGRGGANLCNGYRIVGKFDRQAWLNAVDVVVGRNEILRSQYLQQSDEQAVRAVSGSCGPAMFVSELLKGSSREEKERDWAGKVPAMARQAFDLSKLPLFRMHLGQISAEEHLFLLVMHHIISDGDVSAESFLKQVLAELDGSPAAYIETAVPEDKRDHDPKGLAFWRDYLDEAPQHINLPRDLKPQRSDSSACSVNLPKELVAQLNTLAASCQCSLSNVLMSAYGLLLKTHTAQDTILIAWPDPVRDPQNKEIGYFGQPLPIRFSAPDGSTFRDAIIGLRASFQSALAHADTPFADIVKEVAVLRNSRRPLIQTMFDLQPACERLHATGIQFEPQWWDTQISEYEWALFLFKEGSGAITGRIEYQAEHHDEVMMQQVAERLCLLLKQMVCDPEQTAFTPLTSVDVLQLRQYGEGLAIDLPDDCAHEWFERQAAITPDSIAIEFRGETLTYQELNESANRYARYLRNQGIKKGVVVGLCLERSVLAVTTLLAIWKAGGAFLPLDPAYPVDRLEFMLRDSQAKLLLIETELGEKLDVPDECKILPSTDLVVHSCLEQSHNLGIQSGHDQLNYLIYTSGSTGIPKGIAMVHRCLVNIIAWQLHTSPMRQELRTLQFASLNFDICFQEMFTTWCAGGTLVLLDETTRRDSVLLFDYVSEQKINRLFLPFVALQQLALVAQSRNNLPVALREVLTAGEQLRTTPALCSFFDRLPNCSLQNQYGPSEAHVITSLSLPAQTKSWPALPAVGKPLSNTQIVLVDKNLKPVPPYCPGEVLNGGAGLASGYLHRPELTAASFISDAFSNVPGKKLYRTGDLARFLPDGTLEFLRRVDHQVKVRGFRVDLGEVESALGQHPLVRETVAVVRGEAAQSQLVAYAVLHAKEQTERPLESAQVADWQTLWDSTYKTAADSDFNLAGWNSSYTGKAIAEKEMREWRDQTVSRVLALKPERVLEIGCGSGLLLTQIAPHCKFYAASDFSSEIIERLQARIQASPELVNKVDVRQAEASAIDEWPGESFDTIILNSVLQLFPSAHYLEEVLAHAIKRLTPGGRIFVGDVQNFDLLDAYHAGVQIDRNSDASLAQAANAWRKARALEDQLTISPDFFKQITKRLPLISNVRLDLKRGKHHNELNKFRYDVVLSVGMTHVTDVALVNLNYTGISSLAEVEASLKADRTSAVQLKNIPNARLQPDLVALVRLKNELTPQLQASDALAPKSEPGLDPEDCWKLAEQLGADCHISWSENPGCFDVHWSFDPDYTPALACNENNRPLFNDPLLTRRQQQITGALLDYLKTRLPEYMVPSHLILLDSLPTKTSGKVNYQELPSPDFAQSQNWESPKTSTEKLLAAIWEETLGVSNAGINDDFFMMGGHSLLAVQLQYRIREKFAVDVSLVQLFESRTINSLAQRIDFLLEPSAEWVEEGVL